MKVSYPLVREELIDTMKSLSDYSYQMNGWVDGRFSDDRHEDFNYVIHFLYDDNLYVDNISAEIGDTLKDEAEAKVVTDVITAIDSVFNKYGKNLSDEEYINLPEWESVLNSAKAAYDYLVANDKVKSG